MQQLESRLLLYPDPYDACPPKVRKGADVARRTSPAARCRAAARSAAAISFGADAVVHVAEKLQRQMAMLATAPTPAPALRRAAAPSSASMQVEQRVAAAQSRRRGASVLVHRRPADRRQLDRDVREPVRRAPARGTARLVVGDWSVATLSCIGQQQREATARLQRALHAQLGDRRGQRRRVPCRPIAALGARVTRRHAVRGRSTSPSGSLGDRARRARTRAGEQRLAQRLEARRAPASAAARRRQLDARQVLVIAHAQVAGDAERPQRRLGTLDLLEALRASPRFRTAAATRGRATTAAARSGGRARRDASRMCCFVNPSSASGLATPCSRAACAPGRQSARSSAFVPSATVVEAARARDRHELAPELRLAEVAAIARVGRVPRVVELGGVELEHGERRTTARRRAPPPTAPRGRTRCAR